MFCRIDEWRNPSHEALAGGRGMYARLFAYIYVSFSILFPFFIDEIENACVDFQL